MVVRKYSYTAAPTRVQTDNAYVDDSHRGDIANQENANRVITEITMIMVISSIIDGVKDLKQIKTTVNDCQEITILCTIQIHPPKYRPFVPTT